MNKPLKVASILSIGLLLGLQEEVAGEDEEEIHEFSFTVFAPDVIEDVRFEKREGELSPRIRSYNNARSEEFEYEGTLPLRFWLETPGSSGEREPFAVLTELPETESDRFLFYFAPPPKGQKLHKIYVFPDDDETLPPGHLNILNASGYQLVARIGGGQMMVEQGLSPALPVNGQVAIRIQLAFQMEGEWIMGLDEHLRFNFPDTRATLVILPPYSTARPMLTSRVLRTVPEPEIDEEGEIRQSPHPLGTEPVEQGGNPFDGPGPGTGESSEK